VLGLCSAILAGETEAPVYKKLYPDSAIPIESVAFANIDDTYHFIYKLRKDAEENFTINCIYIFTDDDPKTGRKDAVGNEYYIAPAKTKLTYYSDTYGGGAYKAVKTTRIGNLLFISSRSSWFSHQPLKEFKILVATNKGKLSVAISPKHLLEKIAIPTPPSLPKGRTFRKRTPKRPPINHAFLTVKRPGRAKPPTLTAWIDDSTFRISGSGDYTGHSKLTISAAKNEKIDFQIGVWVGKRIRGKIKITSSDLQGPNGNVIKKSAIAMYHVKSLLFMEPVDKKMKYKVKLYGPLKFRKRMVYDRLQPYKPGTPTGDYKGMMNKSFNVFWCTLHVPMNAEPGIHKGTIDVEMPSKKVELKLEVHVIDFAIPEKPSFTMFAAMVRNVNYRSSIFNRVIAGGYPCGMTLDYEKCLRNFAEHRVALRAMSVSPTLKFDKAGDPVIDFTDFDKMTAFILDDLKMNPKLALPFGSVSWGHGSRYAKAFGPIGYHSMSDEFKTKYVKTLRSVAKHLKKRGWMDSFLAYFSDEPAADQVEQTKTIARLIKKADPDYIPWFYGGGPDKNYMDVINTWQLGYGAPLEEGEGSYTPEAWKKAVARGDRIGIYNPWEAYLMNIPPAYTRTLYWWAYKQKLYWMSMFCIGSFSNYGPNVTNYGYW
jgi:hypothetical protein